jgi:helix-turn-helix, Psq domain
MAVTAVFINHVSKKKAASMYGIPRSTLQRYIKECEGDGGVEKKDRGRQTTLTKEQESELCSVLLDMERRLYGLRPQCVRKIVYQYCVENNIPHTFSDEDKSAGKKWLRLFLSRNPDLSIRKPEGMSIQRAQGYNKSKIKIFEQVLKNELFDENGMRRIPAENIFNVDETGVCVNQKPHKILAKKGKKSV